MKKRNISLIAEPDGFSLSIVEKLLAKSVRVNIVTENIPYWEKISNHLKHNINFQLIKLENVKYLSEEDYVIFVSLLFSNISEYDLRKFAEIEEARLNLIQNNFSNPKKIIYLLPLVNEKTLVLKANEFYKDIEQNLNTRIVFIGQLYGPRMVLNSRDYISKIAKGILVDNVLYDQDKISKEIVYPTFIPKASEMLIKLIFQKELPKNKVAICGRRVKMKDLQNILFQYEKCIPDIAFPTQIRGECSFLLTVEDRSLKYYLNETLNWFRQNDLQPYMEKDLTFEKQKIQKARKGFRKPNLSLPLKNVLNRSKENVLNFAKKSLKNGRKQPLLLKNIQPEKYRKVKKYKEGRILKRFVFALSLVLTLLIIPVVLLAFSFLFLLYGQKELYKGNFKNTAFAFNTAGRISGISNVQFAFYSRAPFVGRIFVSGERASFLAYRISEIAALTSKTGSLAVGMLGNILKGDRFNIGEYSKTIYLDLDKLYKLTSFFQGELDNSGLERFKIVNKIVKTLDLERRRQEINAAKIIVDNLKDILGEKETKSYLVLFQNNMELRPTGGFIGSFALVKFEGGGLVNINIFDVYDADGQLKGYVEPPWPIREYLKEAGWYLRDANWDPDFPTSAQRIEWFLDKEMDVAVDGVIALDLAYVKDLISVVGPLQIIDFEKRITEDNFYEVTQYESEKDFFPGSRKKANFLTAVANSLVMRLKEIKNSEYVSVFKATYASLNTRHIQIFFHEKNIQQGLSSLNWDGAFYQPKCVIDNCYSDWFSLNEANLGVNKANYYIQREIALKVFLHEGEIEREAELTIKNNANSALGERAKYKVYIRLIVPGDIVVNKVNIKEGDNFKEVAVNEDVVQGRKEIGFYLEVAPGQTRNVFYNLASNYDLDYQKNGEYRLYIRKQAGIDSFSFSGQVSFPQDLTVGVDPLLSLTEEGRVDYNSLLDKDFDLRLFW